jgi:hypothetical protein
MGTRSRCLVIPAANRADDIVGTRRVGVPVRATVRTASGAREVQIVHSSRRGARDIEHIGSAHDEAELEVLTAAARQRLAAGQDELDPGLQPTGPAHRRAGGPLPITSSRMGHLVDALIHAYRCLGSSRP